MKRQGYSKHKFYVIIISIIENRKVKIIWRKEVLVV